MYGYLVAWERQHLVNEWEFLGFTTALYWAELIAEKWNEQIISIAEADDCPACAKELAYIFETRPYGKEN